MGHRAVAAQIQIPPVGRRIQTNGFNPPLQHIQPRRTALLSGWALDGPSTPARLGCDAAFALSDHCDFDELLTFVERSRARRVLTLHGFADELATQLRRRGLDASALRSTEQLALALS